MSDRHQPLNLLKHHFYAIDLPFHIHGGAERPPDGTRFPAIWLDTQGLHFFQCDERVSVGRVAHEAGHWALMAPSDRARVELGCLGGQGIFTCGHDHAAEAWAAAAAAAIGLDIPNIFTDVEDYCQFDTDPHVLSLAIASLMEEEKHAGVRSLKDLEMMTKFPDMKLWIAQERQVRLHKKRCRIDLLEDLASPFCPIGLDY